MYGKALLNEVLVNLHAEGETTYPQTSSTNLKNRYNQEKETCDNTVDGDEHRD